MRARESDASAAAACCTGSELASRVRCLRANDLVWHYVVNNYLKGKAPPPFDLLYWNGDATNLPGPMYCLVPAQHLPREQPARAGQARCSAASRSTCRAIDVPAYVYASREDHIVPWRRAYATHAAARRRDAVRARRERPHRRRDQPAGQEASATTGPTSKLPRRCAKRGCDAAHRASPAAGGRLDRMARSRTPAADRAAPQARPATPKYTADRAGARPLRQGEGRMTRPPASRSAVRHPKETAWNDIVIVAAARTAVGKFGGIARQDPGARAGRAS